MLMKHIVDAYEVLDSTYVTGEKVKEYLLGIKPDANIEVYELVGPKGSTDVQLLLQQSFLICRTKEISWKVTYLFPHISARMHPLHLMILFRLWDLR